MKLRNAALGAFAFFSGLVVAYIVYLLFFQDSACYLKTLEVLDNDPGRVIPKVVMQTHYDLASIPEKVAAQFDEYGSGFERILFDDAAAKAFILGYFSTDTAECFEAFPVGAHKADFFRYCYLYVMGGVYLDIKTQLVRPLQEIYDALQQQGSSMATCLTHSPLLKHTWLSPCIYQGVIFARPRHPIFLECLEFMKAYSWRGKLDYMTFCHNFTKRLYERGIVGPGVHPKQGWTLWSEKIYIALQGCDGKRSKNGLCSSIVDEDTQERLFVTRFADFPWGKRKGNIFN